MSGNCACDCKMNINGECIAQCQKYLEQHKGSREARDNQMREEGAKAERDQVLGAFDPTKTIDNCETCKFRPHELCDCNLAEVAISTISDWEKFCPLKKIEESIRLPEQKQEPLCKFASWLDGYFLCKSQKECEFQEGAGLTFYCGRWDALRVKQERS